jgi:hypothetical protein
MRRRCQGLSINNRSEVVTNDLGQQVSNSSGPMSSCITYIPYAMQFTNQAMHKLS